MHMWQDVFQVCWFIILAASRPCKPNGSYGHKLGATSIAVWAFHNMNQIPCCKFWSIANFVGEDYISYLFILLKSSMINDSSHPIMLDLYNEEVDDTTWCQGQLWAINLNIHWICAKLLPIGCFWVRDTESQGFLDGKWLSYCHDSQSSFAFFLQIIADLLDYDACQSLSQVHHTLAPAMQRY